MPPRHIVLEKRLKGKRVCVCVGAGGVGKTTVSAALALGLAMRGRKAVVVSIDPARRLANALGLQELPNEPHRIEPSTLASHGIAAKGELWATMLDSKRTFDELIARLAPDERAREEVLSNRIYRELSSAVAGSQEFTAVAKLFDLYDDGRWDTIVLDTPPSRDALDFLDAPDRLGRFLDGRALKVLLAPGGAARGLFGRGAGLMLSVFARVTGVNLIDDLSGLFGALAGLTDGFRERAHGVEQLLRDPATAFLIVTSPEREPAREAVFLHAQLARERMSFGGLIVNRVHDRGLDGHRPEQAAELLSGELGEALAARVAGNLADFDVLARRDRETVAALSSALGEGNPLLVPHLDGDVQDLGGLAAVAERLFA
ncbi:MAG TPA: ArsA-related P-loop ATPase [Solirubrobacteraceae bacterium]|nr:ArsA-related P-loop ATPase [Solirubrobacteraceae bacterium]